MLWALIWTFHLDYDQPAGFSLKVPTFIYIFVFIAVRALRFDARFVASMGAFAAVGWVGLVAYALAVGGPEMMTRNFVEYLNGPYVLIGAEFDKVLTIAVVTGVLSLAVWRGRRTLLTAVREEAAGRDLRRFLSEGVAEAVTDAEDEVVAGRAEARDAAVLMLDIRGFTGFSGSHTPDEVVALLTSFHARAVPRIRAEGGVVDKFLGDGVMATFGAVSPSPTAARDALTALEAVMAEAARWSEETGTGLVVNGAVAAGPVVFAALGHANRLEFTVIGEAVNLAAKLEKHNKTEGSRALTTAACFDRARGEGFAAARPPERLSERRVAGVATPLDLVVVAR
jgi:adenylate cyclase